MSLTRPPEARERQGWDLIVTSRSGVAWLRPVICGILHCSPLWARLFFSRDRKDPFLPEEPPTALLLPALLLMPPITVLEVLSTWVSVLQIRLSLPP